MIGQEYINQWIGKRFIESLSYIYCYIPILLTWIILILRNNSLKKSGLIGLILACLIATCYYLQLGFTHLLVLSSDYSSTIVIVTSFIAFSLLLFKCRLLGIVLFLEVLMLWYIGWKLSDYFVELIFGGIMGSIFYMIFNMICMKLSFDSNKSWITEKYTRSGYLKSDVYILINMLILTCLFNILLVFW